MVFFMFLAFINFSFESETFSHRKSKLRRKFSGKKIFKFDYFVLFPFTMQYSGTNAEFTKADTGKRMARSNKVKLLILTFYTFYLFSHFPHRYLQPYFRTKRVQLQKNSEIRFEMA